LGCDLQPSVVDSPNETHPKTSEPSSPSDETIFDQSSETPSENFENDDEIPDSSSPEPEADESEDKGDGGDGGEEGDDDSSADSDASVDEDPTVPEPNAIACTNYQAFCADVTDDLVLGPICSEAIGACDQAASQISVVECLAQAESKSERHECLRALIGGDAPDFDASCVDIARTCAQLNLPPSLQVACDVVHFSCTASLCSQSALQCAQEARSDGDMDQCRAIASQCFGSSCGAELGTCLSDGELSAQSCLETFSACHRSDCQSTAQMVCSAQNIDSQACTNLSRLCPNRPDGDDDGDDGDSTSDDEDENEDATNDDDPETTDVEDSEFETNDDLSGDGDDSGIELTVEQEG
jgi:hypothetical protein